MVVGEIKNKMQIVLKNILQGAENFYQGLNIINSTGKLGAAGKFC